MTAAPDADRPAPLAIYPCTSDLQWALFHDSLAVVTRQTSGRPRHIFWLDDIDGVNYKEPGREPGSAQILLTEGAREQVPDESDLIFPLEIRFAQARREFLQTLATVAPACHVQETSISPSKDLQLRMRAARQAEKDQARKARRDAFEANHLERTLLRPDGTKAPRPVSVIGSAFGKHLRLYPDALVFVDPHYRRREGGQYENPLFVSDLRELQWARTTKNKCYLAPPPSGRQTILNIPDDPLAVECSLGDMQSGLERIKELYPELAIREVAVFSEHLVNFDITPGHMLNRNIGTALRFIPGFEPGKHIAGIGDLALAVDPANSKLIVLNVRSWVATTYTGADVMSVEVFEDGQSISRAHKAHQKGNKVALAGALVGEPFSLAGGLIAANRAKPREVIHEVAIRLALDDQQRPILDLPLFRTRSHPIQRGSARHNSLSRDARSWASIVTAMMQAAAAEASPDSPPARLGIAEELSQLARLHAEGVLNDAEFSHLKAKVIGGA